MVAYGATVDLTWDANTEPDLAGYKIYYGTASGNYSHSIDVGNTTQYTLTGLDEGVTYYIAATAYDVDNNESAYSVELVHTTGTLNNTITPSTRRFHGYQTFTFRHARSDGDALESV